MHVSSVRAIADAEYTLLTENGRQKTIVVRMVTCCSCGDEATAGMQLDVLGLKADSDIQELFMRMTGLVPQVKPSEKVLRAQFTDKDDATVEVMKQA